MCVCVCLNFHNPDFLYSLIWSVSQVSEQQLNDAIAQAVENSKLRKDKNQWSMDGEIFIYSLFIFRYSFMFVLPMFWHPCPKYFFSALILKQLHVTFTVMVQLSTKLDLFFIDKC